MQWQPDAPEVQALATRGFRDQELMHDGSSSLFYSDLCCCLLRHGTSQGRCRPKAFGEDQEKGTTSAARGTSNGGPIYRHPTSLTSAVPGDLLFTPRSRGASSQSGNVELKGSWWLSLELQKCNLSRCGRPVEHQSRPPFDPQPAWQSGVGTTLPSQPPGHLHDYKTGLTFLEFRQPDKHQALWNENPR